MNEEADGDVRLERFLRRELADDAFVLKRCPLACISKVYEAHGGDGRRYFVKWGFASAECSAEFLRRNAGHPLLPEDRLGRSLAFEGHPVTVSIWRDVTQVPIEQMSDAQYASLATAKAELSRLLNEPGMVAYMKEYAAQLHVESGVRGPAVRPGDCLETVKAFAAAHPLVRWALRPLLAIGDDSLRRDPAIPIQVNHGDFHAGNFGFDGERVVAFFDFDNLALEYPIEDMVRLFSESVQDGAYRRHALLRRRLFDRFAKYVRSMDCAFPEWRFAINRLRLYYARNTLMRHFGQARVAFRVARRDRRLRTLLDIAEQESRA